MLLRLLIVVVLQFFNELYYVERELASVQPEARDSDHDYDKHTLVDVYDSGLELQLRVEV